MKHSPITPLLLLVTLLLAAPSAIGAQTILVTTGEHATFTRLVLQSADPIDWLLAPSGTARVLRIIPGDARINLSRAFQRIPRTRLSELERSDEGLVLHLGCDCPIRAWAERPGLVVLDIHNAPIDLSPDTSAPRTDPRALPAPVPGSELARMAGIALAREWSDGTDPLAASYRLGGLVANGPMPSPIAEGERHSIMHQLTTQIAGALGQGILEPSLDPAARSRMLLPAASEVSPDIPPNLRIMSVLDRPGDDPVQLADESSQACSAALSLTFAVSPAPASFNQAMAELMQQWIGEFDQPDQAATMNLIALYLQHGFGAEARALIENAPLPVIGRDLLLGFADMLEGRQSNSRLRLAEQHTCGGVGAMLAALAGAPARRINAHANEIAAAFAQAPMVLRVVIGGDLARALIESGATDAGRVVADTLRRTPGVRPEDMAVIDALLDRTRGNMAQATERLDRDAGEDAEALLLRLNMALETGETLREATLLNAEAIASSQRSLPAGIDLMAASIRMRVAAGQAGRGLQLLDRLASWQAGGSPGSTLLGSLSDTVWHGLAAHAPDADFLETVLARPDWNNPAFAAQTRTALAERLLDFGLADAAQPLLDANETAVQRYLLAGLYLSGNRPEQALDVLADDQSDRAQELRAQALQAQGDGRESGVILARLGAFDAAAHNAVLARDWGFLADIAASSGSTQQQDLARVLRSHPGETLPTDALQIPTAAPRPAEDDSANPAGIRAGFAPEGIGDASLAPQGAGRNLEDMLHVTSAPPVPDALQRGAILLAESARLRETLGQLARQGTAAVQP